MFSLRSKKDKKVVPVVDIKGVIQAGGRSSSPFGGGSSSINIDGMRAKLKAAFNTAGAVAVVLDINCPGGSPTQSELVGKLIRDLAEEKNIPVYAFAQDVAASGGYWIACAADEIYAAITSTIGSIGVVTQGLDLEGAGKKIGIKNRTFTAGDNKRRLDPFEPVSPEDEKWMNDRLSTMHDFFKSWVKERRGDKFKAPAGISKDDYLDKEVFTGDTWFGGEEAAQNGLIDGVAYLDNFIEDKFGKDVVIKRERAKKKGLLSSLLIAFTGASAEQPVAQLNAKELIAAAADVMRDEVIWSRYDLH